MKFNTNIYLALILLFIPKYSISATTPKIIQACQLDSLLTVANSQAYAEVKPQQLANLTAEISGKVIDITIEVGDKITKGDVLFKLDDRQWQLQLKQLDADIKGIKARLKLANYQLKQRTKLHRGGNVSEELLHQHKTEVASLTAELESQNFQKQQLQLTLSKTKITAPFSGVIIQREVNLGEWVDPGQPVASLLNPTKVEIKAFLDAQQLANLTTKTRLKLHINKQVFPVKRQTLLPMLDADKNLQPIILKPTGKIPLPGSQGQLRWQTTTKKIPFRYSLKVNESYGLMLLVDNKAQFHKLPEALPGRSIVVDLPAKTLVITTGFRQLKTGDLVKNKGCSNVNSGRDLSGFGNLTGINLAGLNN
ncbi:efflux RND transporter periplasmic adaptor subunit [Candidatus Halobeggiatoa sp. HSG11]|nr:efflux RND transporter periplasmic adaptor subunit [Candidatus Halobeggiatoa sp. HSG11]